MHMQWNQYLLEYVQNIQENNSLFFFASPVYITHCSLHAQFVDCNCIHYCQRSELLLDCHTKKLSFIFEERVQITAVLVPRSRARKTYIEWRRIWRRKYKFDVSVGKFVNWILQLWFCQLKSFQINSPFCESMSLICILFLPTSTILHSCTLPMFISLIP